MLFSKDSQTQSICYRAQYTGTRSAKKALINFGYDFGDQRTAALFLDDLIQGDFSGLLRFCQNAEAFKRIPFSCPKIYEALDKEFPGSRFILTIRDSSEQWFESLVTFHSKILQTPGTPTYDDLASSTRTISRLFVESYDIYFSEHAALL
ncbi:MAG: sulfotransferase [Cyanobacteriota bacterium]